MFWNYGRRRTGTGSDGDQPFSFIRFLSFAKNQPGNVFQKEDWLDFFTGERHLVLPVV